MSVSIDYAIEAKLDGTTWTDITGDVLDVTALVWRRGMGGSRPTDRVAGTGKLSFALNNSASNSGGVVGYYSPAHANARSGFDLGLPVRIVYTYGATSVTKFTGRVASVDVEFDTLGRRITRVTAYDYMDIVAKYKLAQIAVVSSQRADQVIDTVISALPIAPTSTSYATDPDTYTRALNTERDEATTARTVCQKVAQSSLGFVYVKGDDTLKYDSRHSRIASTTVDATFSDDMRGLSVVRKIEDIVTEVKAVTYPVHVSTDATLYQARSEISIAPSGSISFVARYTDSSTGRRVSAENVVTPVADTDYKASATAGGGNELNADLTITLDKGANSVAVTLENGTSGTMYVSLFKIRGDALLLYDPYESIAKDASAQATYGYRAITLDMAYQDNPNTGDDFANHLLNSNKAPDNIVGALIFIANKSATLAGYARDLDVGSRVSVLETMTGVSGEYFVQSVEHTIYHGKIDVRIGLVSAVSGAFWFLGTAGLSELDDTTVLGF